MKAGELRNLSKEELIEKEKQLRRELFNLKFQKESGQLGDISLIKKTKKDLARVLTILRELELKKLDKE